jgi:two-component system nitrogen regulation response regulator NtrX
MQNFDWKGNVRQLENEVNSIINLTDDGEIISFEILSEELKNQDKEPKINTVALPYFKNKEMEKEFIIKKLQENNWNKSKTAREINMTYRGLHKKMNKLGIQKPE